MNKAQLIANNVLKKFGDFFKHSTPEVQATLIRAEAWLVLTQMEDETISAASVSRLIDAELKAEELLQQYLKKAK